MSGRGTPHNFRHGHSHIDGKHTQSPTYKSWCAMRVRCKLIHRDPTKKYAGRGITICKEWDSFEQFLSDMGERPAGKTLDRIDNNGPYCASNCRWATASEQARNRRCVRLTVEKAIQIAFLRLLGLSFKVIAKSFGISEGIAREVYSQRSWKEARPIAEQRFHAYTHFEVSI